MKYAFIILFFFLILGCLPKNIQVTPKDTKPVTTKIELGKKLFFDNILSLDQTISCASCHKPEFAFADNRPLSLGVHGKLGTRNTPSVMNMASRPHFFYDGRANTLEEQAIIPIENPVEMNLPYEKAVERIRTHKTYPALFLKIFNEAPNANNIAIALAEFQRSLESDGSAPNDQWLLGLDTTLMTDSQKRGHEIFISDDSKCFDCHFGPDFTGDEFRNIGLYDNMGLLDRGRFDITKDSSDLGKFKVPGLRNVALTAPYMHNGMFNTLEEVIDYYSNPYDFVERPINMDSLMLTPLNLTDQEKADLVNFLKSLTDQNIPYLDMEVSTLE